jgi:hypothetical protein
MAKIKISRSWGNQTRKKETGTDNLIPVDERGGQNNKKERFLLKAH